MAPVRETRWADGNPSGEGARRPEAPVWQVAPGSRSRSVSRSQPSSLTSQASTRPSADDGRPPRRPHSGVSTHSIAACSRGRRTRGRETPGPRRSGGRSPSRPPPMGRGVDAVLLVRRAARAPRPSRGRPGGSTCRCCARTSTASSFVPSGDQSTGSAYCPSPKTARVSPVSTSRDPASMSVGVRAFAAYASFVPSGDQASPPDEVLDLGRVGELLGPAAVGIEQVELVELVAVAVGGEHDRAVVAATTAIGGRSARRRPSADRGQPPPTGTRQRLNCPEMLLTNSTCAPSGVNAEPPPKRRYAV